MKSSRQKLEPFAAVCVPGWGGTDDCSRPAVPNQNRRSLRGPPPASAYVSAKDNGRRHFRYGWEGLVRNGAVSGHRDRRAGWRVRQRRARVDQLSGRCRRDGKSGARRWPIHRAAGGRGDRVLRTEEQPVEVSVHDAVREGSRPDVQLDERWARLRLAERGASMRRPSQR